MEISKYQPARWVRSKQTTRRNGITRSRMLIKYVPPVVSPRGEQSLIPGGFLFRAMVAMGFAR